MNGSEPSSGGEGGASSGGSKTGFDAKAEQDKIKSGEYPSRVIQGRQNKHIEGTKEFEQKRESMKKKKSSNEPAILKVDAQALVDKYKGTGYIYRHKSSPYPKERIKADRVIGKTWVQSKQKYVDTDTFVIHYSRTGTHIVPKNTYRSNEDN